MAAEQGSKKRDSEAFELEIIEALTTYLTLSIEEVADWHFTDVALHREWDRPLGRVLRFLMDDAELISSIEHGEAATESSRSGALVDVTDALVDIREDISGVEDTPAMVA